MKSHVVTALLLVLSALDAPAQSDSRDASTSDRTGTRSAQGTPCLVWTNEIRPLIVGDTARIPVGKLVSSDCDRADDPGYEWSTSDPKIVEISRDGLIKGIAPGVFRVSAIRDKTVLNAEGFVLPRGWTLAIEPATASVRVGESVTFNVTARDPMGRDIPGIPFDILTPPFLRISSEPPIVDKWSYQNRRGPTIIGAVRPGTTILTGKIARKRVTAQLTILPAADIQR